MAMYGCVEEAEIARYRESHLNTVYHINLGLGLGLDYHINKQFCEMLSVRHDAMVNSTTSRDIKSMRH